eukprot:3436515-Rhodomonas_salina.1
MQHQVRWSEGRGFYGHVARGPRVLGSSREPRRCGTRALKCWGKILGYESAHDVAREGKKGTYASYDVIVAHIVSDVGDDVLLSLIHI